MLLLATASLSFLAPEAHAQQAPQQPASVKPAQSLAIETVVVTARRRSENLEKTPVAATVLNGEMIRLKNINTAMDLQTHTPSLTVSASLGSRDDNVFTIRGQSQPFGGADPGVQTYFNDVPFNSAGPGNEYDMDSVQVYRGPQGTYYGRNTTGGAVLFEPKRPDDEFGGYVDASAGDYAMWDLKGAVNVPLDDTLSVRVAGDFGQRSGYTKDTIFDATGTPTGRETLDNQNYNAFRIGLNWKPTSNFQNYAVFDFYRDHNNGTGAELTSVSPNTINGLAQQEGLNCAAMPANPTCAALGAFEAEMQGALALQKSLGPRQTTSSIPLFFRRDSWGFTDITTFDVATHLHLENIFGFRSDKEQPSFDYDGSLLPILAISNPRTWESNGLQVTDEFQVKGETSDNALNWIVGFYHELDHPGGYSEVERDTFGGAQPIFSPFFGFGSTEVDSLANGGTSNAVYASGTYDASSMLHGLSFTAGGRYTWDHKVATSRTCISQDITMPCPSPLPGPSLQQAANFRAPSWNLTAQDQVTDDTMVYADYRRGYKSGGFNSGAGFATDFEEFKPEYLTDVELGTKNNWTILGVPGRTNFDVYYGWYSDIQKNDLVAVIAPPVIEPVALTFNAARATVKGLEFESTFIPNENFQVDVFYSYTDATYNKVILPTEIFVAGATQTPIGPLDHSGNPFAYTPKNKFGITPRFHIPISDSWGQPYLSATYYWQDKVWFSDLSDLEPDASQKAYSLIDARLDWDNFLGHPFDLSAFVTNLTNKTYKQGADALLHLTGTSASIYGPPRMWSVELRYRFGADGN
jgi:iron complex outermembrane receptor protein